MMTICPVLSCGARMFLMQSPKDSVSEDPSMLIEGPIPSKVIEEMSVTFFPQFLGAFPYALSPFGALAYRGVRAMLVEDSSTKIRRLGSTPLRRSLKAPRASSSRSVAPSVFFVSPAQLLSYGPAHRGDGHRSSRFLMPHIAVTLQSSVIIFFELLPRSLLLFEGGKDTPLASCGSARREILSLSSHPEPAFQCRKRDGEGFYNIPSWDAPIYCAYRPDSEILRVNVHAQYSCAETTLFAICSRRSVQRRARTGDACLRPDKVPKAQTQRIDPGWLSLVPRGPVHALPSLHAHRV